MMDKRQAILDKIHKDMFAYQSEHGFHSYFDFLQEDLEELSEHLKSQPLPIEGVERGQFSINEVKKLISDFCNEYTERKNYDLVIGQWLATRKGSTETR